jgi:hypothetical protein
VKGGKGRIALAFRSLFVKINKKELGECLFLNTIVGAARTILKRLSSMPIPRLSAPVARARR